MSRRRPVALFLGLGVVVAVVVVVLVLVRDNTTTVLDADQALGAATATTTIATSPASKGEPAEGEAVVYVYETVGFEEIDALAGTRHDYPPETFLSIQPGGCGQVFRWQAIEERWTSWEVCDPDRLTVAGVDSFHRWFGVDDLQQYRCSDPASYLPPSAEVATWTFVCSAGERIEETTVDVVGVETLAIGGQEVETLHLRFTTTLTGESTGGSVTYRWFRSDDGLLVKEVSSTVSATSSLIGTVNYTEEYKITLQALDPLTP